jgi:hypothetical protein
VVVDRDVVNEEKLLLDRSLEQAEIDGGARPEPGDIEFTQAIVEAAKAGDLGIDGEAGVLVDPAVVFVEPEGGGLKRARGEITADVFFRDAVEFGVGF